ncbi:MAG: hypothetical protein FJ091_18390 [Deltaproteobacteria bacterium]|nr:hypothetical protein [Deltaproteobacteria bacterium]
MRRAGQRVRAAAALLAWVLACGGEPETPESRVRAALAALESAVEAGDVGAFSEGISPSYRDELGHDAQAVQSYLRFHVLRNPNGRELVLRIRDVQLTSAASASVMLHAGLAGAGESQLRANAYALDLDLALEDGEWRVVWAQWKPAAPAELL